MDGGLEGRQVAVEAVAALYMCECMRGCVIHTYVYPPQCRCPKLRTGVDAQEALH